MSSVDSDWKLWSVQPDGAVVYSGDGVHWKLLVMFSVSEIGNGGFISANKKSRPFTVNH